MRVTVGENYGLGETLLCPCCGGTYLHHDTVFVFNRREDAEMVNKTTVEGTRVVTEVVEDRTSGNPSGRRTGLSVDFWCELCGVDKDGEPTKNMRLHILQHKGNTFMQWEVSDRGNK